MPQTASVNTRSLQTESLSADEDRLINDVLLEAGVVDVAGGSFQVTEDTGANMQVSIGSGSAGDKAVTKNADRVYIGEHENASQLLALSASDPTDDRIDLVVFRTYDDEADSSGNTYSDIEIIEGTPAGSPSAPAVPAGAIALAEILVQASVSAITDGDITDRRDEATLREALGHAWQDWTPAFTNLTAGNGSTVARFARMGKLVVCRFSFTLGSTSAVSGAPQVTLPVEAAADHPDFFTLGQAFLRDLTGNVHIGHARLNGASRTQVEIRHGGSAGSSVVSSGVNSTSPFTWATGDVLAFEAAYEAT